MDQLFSTAPGSPNCFPRRRTPAVGVCDRSSAALHSACPCGDDGSALRKHRGLPHAGPDVDSRLLVRGSGDAWRRFFVQHGARLAFDERVYGILFQLYYIEHSRLRRHHSSFTCCALACSNGSNDRSAVCGGLDRPTRFSLFEFETRRFSKPISLINSIAVPSDAFEFLGPYPRSPKVLYENLLRQNTSWLSSQTLNTPDVYEA